MKIVLATGIYPPDIGGPATYVSNLAAELSKNVEVVVVSYQRERGPFGKAQDKKGKGENWEVVGVKKGFPILRWFSYANALKKVGKNADIVYAFSSVSCGVPLWLSGLKKPKRVLRLGGDFGWERYTDWGGKKGLREWYEKGSLVFGFWFLVSRILLKTFDHIIFSTRFQEELYENHFKRLPKHSVIQNALPEGNPEYHAAHEPFRILFMGRFVGFKNLETFLNAVKKIDARVTMVGEGPEGKKLRSLASDKVIFVAPVSGEEKRKIFESHDLMIIPSITELSPNVALEARASGLPVLLTEETGLSEELSEAMVLRDLSSVDSIVSAVEEVKGNFRDIAKAAAEPLNERSWNAVTREHQELFSSVLKRN